MQIFSPSHTPCSSQSNIRFRTKGFTLIELLISLALIGVITTVTLANYKGFDSTTILKGQAYEIALALRETQAKSLSVVRDSGSGSFDYPYGLSFTRSWNTYTLFKDINGNTIYSGTSEDLSIITMDGKMQVSDLCVVVSGVEDCSAVRLDISFKRPEFKAFLYAGPSFSGIESAKIKVNTTSSPGDVFVIEISQFGQISVSNE